MSRAGAKLLASGLLLLAPIGAAFAGAVLVSEGALGPYNLVFLQGGVGSSRTLPAGTRLDGTANWSLTAWVKPDLPLQNADLVAVVGEPAVPQQLRLSLSNGALELCLAGQTALRARAALPVGAWSAIAVSVKDRHVRLFLGGDEIDAQTLGDDRESGSGSPLTLQLAPTRTDAAGVAHFGGALADLRLHDLPLTPAQIAALAANPPKFELLSFTQVGVGWPLQETAWIGLQVPQDPWTLPQGKAAASAPTAIPVAAVPPLRQDGENTWIVGHWGMLPASAVRADGERLSDPRFEPGQSGLEGSGAPQREGTSWYPATVPGTVLSTLIDRGVYPDPDYGLNNLSIPESLARQDYWYRTRFPTPAHTAGRRFTLTLEGINYSADVWFNGHRLGNVRGAFLRGVFDLTPYVARAGFNALALRVSPPPHPGIPSEESILYGPGGNGGALALDGPTFIATEGWDWIPAIRDRDTGLWRDVHLHVSGAVQLGDPQVVTHLPLPRTDTAEITIHVPLQNALRAPHEVTVEAAFDDVVVRKTLRLGNGAATVDFDPREFPQLRIPHPRLWWPNGYGAPELHLLRLTVRDGGDVSDARVVRFGMRELSYELSLFDHDGRLRRVEVDPTAAPGVALVDVRHAAIKRVPGGWAQSLTAAGERSPAVRDAFSTALTPYLLIRVNGVAIAARGGSWGMDDSRKRIARERLEPYFRLHREAHLNIIRNWLGQNTEDVFYDLADEYGLLVLNDFWESTQDFQLEAQDPALFLANARDVIGRYRNHPSIAVWFGRNEGVPQPIINEGLAELVRTLDGTRLYMGSSNRVNLQDSGPYAYRPPADYFTTLGRGFAVELGTPSLGTLESLRASIPEPDRWPISDTLAYHDWHFGGNGDVAGFMSALSEQFGPASSLEDFERKAQLMNYVDYRAIFEGFAAHLWTANSGRLLWMTHPAWPSNHWQIYASDYDTQASYYGVKKAAEPLHVQMNLPDYSIAVVNTTREAHPGLRVRSRILGLDGRELATRNDTVDAPADEVSTLPALPIESWLAAQGVVLVALTLSDAGGSVLSENLYWPCRDAAASRQLERLAPQTVAVSARSSPEAGETVADVTLRNQGSLAALGVKLTLLDEHGARILPAYYSDNYIGLLPGESRQVRIRFAGDAGRGARLAVRGWNLRETAQAIAIVPGGPAK